MSIKPRYFNEPEWLSSNKENMPPIELVTPPSLRNLSLEEENNEVEQEATMWEANVARNLDPLPRSSSPYPKKTSTLEDLETDTDDNMVNMTDFFERPPNDKRSPRPKQAKPTQIKNNVPHPRIVSHIHQRAQCQQHSLPSPIQMKFGGFSQTKEEYPLDGRLVSEGSHPG